MTDTKSPTLPDSADQVVERVRERYGAIARSSDSGCCGGPPGTPADPGTTAHRLGYSDDQLATLPEEANLGLGCGAPVSLLALQPGETVLDLGSGGGIDAFLAAREVGPDGRVIGVDMTEEMIARAGAAARENGFDQVEFRLGRLEALPVEDASVDAVTSNCVINLVPDKAAVFAEVARVLKPGGRLVVSDVVLDRPLPEAIGRDLLAWVGCVAGALLRDDYFGALTAAGLTGIEVLSDRDAVELFAGEIPAEAAEMLAHTGVTLAELEGRVRSITYRAFRPS